MKQCMIYFDGACFPNPDGAMGVGVFIDYGGQEHEFAEGYEAQKGNTNNVAEYRALMKGLCEAEKLIGVGDEIYILGDSNLVVEQLVGRFKAKDGYYYDDYLRVKDKVHNMKQHRDVYIAWIPREQNHRADRLSKQGMDKFGGLKFSKL